MSAEKRPAQRGHKDFSGDRDQAVPVPVDSPDEAAQARVEQMNHRPVHSLAACSYWWAIWTWPNKRANAGAIALHRLPPW